MLRMLIIALLGVVLFHILKTPMSDTAKIASSCGVALLMMMVWGARR